MKNRGRVNTIIILEIKLKGMSILMRFDPFAHRFEVAMEWFSMLEWENKLNFLDSFYEMSYSE